MVMRSPAGVGTCLAVKLRDELRPARLASQATSGGVASSSKRKIPALSAESRGVARKRIPTSFLITEDGGTKVIIATLF